jgi:DNA polymerase
MSYSPAFDLADIGFIDFETRSKADLKDLGAYAYALEADAIVMAYAIGDLPAAVVSVGAFGRPLHWTEMPREIHAHHARVMAGEAVWCAWNAGFDKAVWNYSTEGFPILYPRHIIDAMAQATSNGLAANLAMAAKQAHAVLKLEEGKELIKLFCGDGAATPQSHPEQWGMFTRYAAADVEAMRSVFKRTLQLTRREWEEYWAMEAVNERGVWIDTKMVKSAARLAAEDKVYASGELRRLTAGEVTSVDQIQRLIAWLLPRLSPACAKVLVKRDEEVNEEGELVRPAKLDLTRHKVERLLAMAEDEGTPPEIVRVLQIRLYGGSKTPSKFRKMNLQAVDDVLYGQYVFNGAPQTGRASSRGVQIHNLARDTLPYEHDAIEALLAGVSYGDLGTLGDDTPVSRKLSLLIRPAFVPGGDRVFVWSDWSQIEARVLPWLCGPVSHGAVQRLEIFRSVDADPDNVPDIYTRTAAVLSGLPIEQVTKPIRQRGKVAELALGFMGGVGALQSMAANYGMNIPDEEAKQIVDRWRKANQWAVGFSRDLWDGAMLAMHQPLDSEPIRIGRVAFKYVPQLLGGTLLMILPSGRFIFYRNIRQEEVPVLDDDDEPTGRFTTEMLFSRGYGRMKLWPGIFVENATQATAADFLRGTLVKLEQQAFMTRLHTHDEILVECAAENAEYIATRLARIMQEGFDWSEGLPLMSAEQAGYYYTKREETGL